jgi:hypothetical protein
MFGVIRVCRGQEEKNGLATLAGKALVGLTACCQARCFSACHWSALPQTLGQGPGFAAAEFREVRQSVGRVPAGVGAQGLGDDVVGVILRGQMLFFSSA